MTKIAVVDDDELFAEKVAEVIRTDFGKKKISVEVECFHNGRRLLANIDDRLKYDVYFLDVEMGYMSGVELAKRIRGADRAAIIIFLTSHEKYAIEGYSCRAFEYITKEKWERRLPEVLNQIQKQLAERNTRVYRIHSERKYEVILWDDIYYLEKNGKNTIFYCRENKIYQDRKPIGEVYKLLSEAEFSYINRGQIVNLQHVTHVDAEIVEVDGSVSLSLSRTMLGEIRQKLLRYWRVE